MWLSELRSKDEELLYLVQRACPDAGTKPGPWKALGPKQGYRLRRQLKNALNGKTGRQESKLERTCVSFGAGAPFVVLLGFEVLGGVLGVDFGLLVVGGGGGDALVHSNQRLFTG